MARTIKDENAYTKWGVEPYFAPPPELSIDEWAEENIVLPTAVSSTAGPINLDWTPYVRGPLQAATERGHVHEITLCWSTQIAKTQTLQLIAIHSIAARKQPAIMFMPREEDARSLCVDRVQPTIRESPRLRRMLTGAKSEMTAALVRLDGVPFYFGGAGSPAGLASRAASTLILDETDKFPPWSGSEADPIKLARERTRTYHDRLIVKASTPTTERGYICRELEASTNERFWVPCPRCGAFQVLIMGDGSGAGVKWPENATGDEILLDRLAWYQCQHCDGRITEEEKHPMVRQGRWVAQGCGIDRKGRDYGTPPPRHRVGYHLWAIYSPWLTFAEIAAEFLNSKDAPAALQNFRNSWQAETWDTTTNELTAPEIRACVAEYEIGTVPEDAWVLVATCDVQEEGNVLFYVIRAWANRDRSWLVRYGTVRGFHILNDILYKSAYRKPSGEEIPIVFVGIDSGYMTHAVYEYCRRVNGVPLKGTATGRQHLQWSNVQHEEIRAPLLLINVNFYKDVLHRLMRMPDLWHLPEGVEDAYYRHMVAEQKVAQVDRKSGRQRIVWKASGANHYFDAEVYQLPAYDVLELRHREDRPHIDARKAKPIELSRQKKVEKKQRGASPYDPAAVTASKVF